jgi:hypothetical protein
LKIQSALRKRTNLLQTAKTCATEILTLAGNTYLVFGVIHLLSLNTMDEFYEHDMIKYERNTSGFVMLLMFFRFSDYMSLIERFSPFIDHMYNVFTDIFYFFLLLLTVILVFTLNFYLIAQNQIDFDISTPNLKMSVDKTKGIVIDMSYEYVSEMD